MTPHAARRQNNRPGNTTGGETANRSGKEFRPGKAPAENGPSGSGSASHSVWPRASPAQGRPQSGPAPQCAAVEPVNPRWAPWPGCRTRPAAGTGETARPGSGGRPCRPFPPAAFDLPGDRNQARRHPPGRSPWPAATESPTESDRQIEARVARKVSVGFPAPRPIHFSPPAGPGRPTPNLRPPRCCAKHPPAGMPARCACRTPNHGFSGPCSPPFSPG